MNKRSFLLAATFVLVFVAIIVSEYLPEKLAARSKAPDSAISSANIQ